MIYPHSTGWLNALGKKAAPALSRMLMRGRAVNAIRLLEADCAILQGKGAGTGWDLENEVNAVAGFIDLDEATVFDVGANRGEWTQRLLRLPGANCRFFLFEPAPDLVAVLRKLNIPRATVIAAAGAKSGRARLFSPEPGSPIASVYPRRDSDFRDLRFDQQAVDMVTIDQVIAEHGIDVVDFMKIDVEEAEPDVLTGASEALHNAKIKALSFEFGSGNLNSRTQFFDIWSLLKSHGLAIKRVCPGGVVIDVEEYYEDLEHYRGVSNYIAVLGPAPNSS